MPEESGRLQPRKVRPPEVIPPRRMNPPEVSIPTIFAGVKVVDVGVPSPRPAGEGPAVAVPQNTGGVRGIGPIASLDPVSIGGVPTGRGVVVGMPGEGSGASASGMGPSTAAASGTQGVGTPGMGSAPGNPESAPPPPKGAPPGWDCTTAWTTDQAPDTLCGKPSYTMNRGHVSTFGPHPVPGESMKKEVMERLLAKTWTDWETADRKVRQEAESPVHKYYKVT